MNLRLAVMTHDLGATVNRVHLHGDGDAEMPLLDADQLALYADSLDPVADAPLVEHLQAMIGQKANP